jgi:hypothetical protein
MSVFVPVPCCFCHYGIVLSPWYSLKSGFVMPPALLFWLTIALARQGLLCFHMNFRIDFSLLMKNVIVILVGIALKIYITFHVIGIFKILFLPIHEIYEHGCPSIFKCLHWFLSSVVFNFNCTSLSPLSLNFFKVL